MVKLKEVGHEVVVNEEKKWEEFEQGGGHCPCSDVSCALEEVPKLNFLFLGRVSCLFANSSVEILRLDTETLLASNVTPPTGVGEWAALKLWSLSLTEFLAQNVSFMPLAWRS